MAAAGIHMKAMILLGINCGFGPADCGTLPAKGVDLATGWINYPRPKTGVPRRIPLWPETVAAIKASVAKRPKPLDEADAGLVFVTKYGQRWPTPVDPAAFRGLAGDFVRAVEPHSEADPVALLIQFMVAFGNVIGRRAHFRAESDQHFLNLFCVLVGRTSKGRKGTSWGRVKKVMEQAHPQWAGSRIVTGLSSGEGLVWEVRDPIVQRRTRQRGGQTEEYEAQADAGVADIRTAQPADLHRDNKSRVPITEGGMFALGCQTRSEVSCASAMSPPMIPAACNPIRARSELITGNGGFDCSLVFMPCPFSGDILREGGACRSAMEVVPDNGGDCTRRLSPREYADNWARHGHRPSG